MGKAEFFTIVDPGHINPAYELRHGHKVWTVGSCFADEIGGRMSRELFDVRVNPLGTLYNPASIAAALERVARGQLYEERDLFEHNGMWHCMDFHSSFSGIDKSQVLHTINTAVAALNSELTSLSHILLTLGSARCFVDTTTRRVAANCHKLPPQRFEIRDLGIEESTALLSRAIDMLRDRSPKLKVIITVSPIRHKAYGYHADKLSKATLLLTAEKLCTGHDTAYFPAYEIMTDELRDYRFYAADMIHPSETAADHIYSCFRNWAYSESTRELATECGRLTKRLNHRILNRETDEYRRFTSETERIAADLGQRHPELSATISEMKQQSE